MVKTLSRPGDVEIGFFAGTWSIASTCMLSDQHRAFV